MEEKRTNNSQLAKEILAEAKGLKVKCELCEEVKGLQIHHIDDNPSNSKIANLIILCIKCHSEKHKNSKWRKRKKQTEGHQQRQKENKKGYDKIYYQKNREKIRRYFKEYYQKNKLKIDIK